MFWPQFTQFSNLARNSIGGNIVVFIFYLLLFQFLYRLAPPPCIRQMNRVYGCVCPCYGAIEIVVVIIIIIIE